MWRHHHIRPSLCSRSPAWKEQSWRGKPSFWAPPLFNASLVPYLPLEIKAAPSQGKKNGFLRQPGAPCWVDLNYICACMHTCACSTQQEIWDRSSLGACPGLLFAGKPGQSWRGPSSAAPAPLSPWYSDASWQGHWQALSGRWPAVSFDTHCLWATSRLCL